MAILYLIDIELFLHAVGYCPDTSTLGDMERSLTDIDDSISDVTSTIKADTIVKLPKEQK